MLHMRYRQQLGFAPPARWREMCMHSTTKKKPLGIHCYPPSYSTLLGSSLQNIASLRRTAHCCPMSMTVQHIFFHSLLLSFSVQLTVYLYRQCTASLLCTAFLQIVHSLLPPYRSNRAQLAALLQCASLHQTVQCYSPPQPSVQCASLLLTAHCYPPPQPSVQCASLLLIAFLCMQ